MNFGSHTRCGAIRFEDLHFRTFETAKGVASFINIEFSDTMLHSTNLGEDYGFKRGVKGQKDNLPEQIFGFGHTKIRDAQSKWMSSLDKLRLAATCWESRRKWGYEGYSWLSIGVLRPLILLLLLWFPFASELVAWRLARGEGGVNQDISFGTFIKYGWKTRKLFWLTFLRNRSGREIVNLVDLTSKNNY